MGIGLFIPHIVGEIRVFEPINLDKSCHRLYSYRIFTNIIDSRFILVGNSERRILLKAMVFRMRMNETSRLDAVESKMKQFLEKPESFIS
jgi:hypothetical protein